MNKLQIFIITFYTAIFVFVILILNYFHTNIPYYENNITDYFINIDEPFLKEIIVYNDLSISLIIFLFIFFLIDQYCNKNINFHLKIIWILKSFTSFFLIIIYENFQGLDQISYFNFVINNTKDIIHFGNLDKLIDFNSPTVNFLLPLKIVNFIFNDSWFMQKLFQNLLYFGTIIFLLKTLSILDERLKDNILTLYLLSFVPSLFLFSSLITKDLIILFILSGCFYTLFKIKKFDTKTVTFILITSIGIFYIYLLRYWISVAILISVFLYVFLKFLKLINIKNRYSLCIISILFFIFCLFYSSFFNDISFKIYTEIFERIKVEHFFPEQSYDKLFLNSGTRLEVLFLYPEALFKTLFNPFLDKIEKPSLFLFSIENLIIFFLLILGIQNFKKINDETLVIFIFILMVSHMYLPIGYLNSGTTLRYAIQTKIFLLLILIYLNSNLLIYINNKLCLFFKKIFQYTETYKSKN